MPVPLEISTRWIDLSPPLEAELRKRAGRLERHYDRITSCRIAVERPTGNHHQEGGPFRVRVDITVPGSELVADKRREELYAAVREAFDAAERQVEEWSPRRRGEVKTPVLPPEGQVVRIFPEEGFGFIAGSGRPGGLLPPQRRPRAARFRQAGGRLAGPLRRGAGFRGTPGEHRRVAGREE